MRLKGKTCVVTAAGPGIGAATARAFAREGAKVWATDVDAGKLEALKGVEGVVTRKLDVLDKAAIGQLATETGTADVLFNCAGFVHHGTVLDATDEYFEAEDALGRWTDERCQEHPQAQALVSDLFVDWKDWAQANGEFAGSIKRFAEMLESRKFGRRRGAKGARYVIGLSLRPKSFSRYAT